VAAPVERCFDLARSIDLHQLSTAATGERAVAGRTSGLIGPGEEVTWRARHLGVWQTLTSRITAYERPVHFRDSQVRGAFRRFDHDHFFAREGDAPLGLLGRAAERIFLTAYMRRFLVERNRVLRVVAESDDWRRFVAP
jgi:ligand-binding SRPBCC domain-containing protein